MSVAPHRAGQTVPPLARGTLDRAAAYRRDPGWLADAWRRARVLLVDPATGGRALVRDGDPPTLLMVSGDEAPTADRLFLGVDGDGTPIFAVAAPLPDVPGAQPVTLRDVGHELTDRDAGVFTAAAALVNWHETHQFAPRTGRPTTVTEGGWARADDDGEVIWPRTDPAMIVLVHDGVPGPDGRCLLGHNIAWAADGAERRYSCLAGYVEPGESAEAAVIREVDEEVGVQLSGVRYEASQAWPFPASLMLGFMAVADPSQPVRVDEQEIVDACWFTRREIAAMVGGELTDDDGVRLTLPMRASIAFFLIERWLADDGV